MQIASLLFSLLLSICILIFPFLSLFLLTRFIHLKAKTLPMLQPVSICELKLGANRYDSGSEILVEQNSCVFCLCGVEEEEVDITQLRCKHLFHSACLDTWINYGWVTCPLCRESLPPWEKKGELAVAGMEEDEVLDSSAIVWMAYMVNQWLFKVVCNCNAF